MAKSDLQFQSWSFINVSIETELTEINNNWNIYNNGQDQCVKTGIMTNQMSAI